MPPNSAQKPDRSALPVIDIAGLRRGDRDDCIAVAAQLRAACLDKGFFYISGHGIAADTIAAVFAASREFFALPEQDKLAVHMQRSFCNRGYEPLRAQTLEAGTPPDLKEGFYSGNDLPLGIEYRVCQGEHSVGVHQISSLSVANHSGIAIVLLSASHSTCDFGSQTVRSPS